MSEHEAINGHKHQVSGSEYQQFLTAGEDYSYVCVIILQQYYYVPSDMSDVEQTWRHTDSGIPPPPLQYHGYP